MTRRCRSIAEEYGFAKAGSPAPVPRGEVIVSCLTRAAMSDPSIPRLVTCRPGWSNRLPLAADLYYHRNNRSGRGTPSHHPGQVARRAGRDEATWGLRGRVARSRFHRSVAVKRVSLGDTSKDTMPGMLYVSGCQWQKFRDPSHFQAFDGQLRGLERAAQCVGRGAL